MKRVTFVVLALVLTLRLLAQDSLPIQEFKGVVVALDPGASFAMQGIRVQTNEGTHSFYVHPHHGEDIIRALRPGDSVWVRASVNGRQQQTKLAVPPNLEWLVRRYAATEVKVNGTWIPNTAQEVPFLMGEEYRVFLEKKIEQELWRDDYRIAIRFDKNQAAFYLLNSDHYYPLKNAKPGEVVSFIGYSTPAAPGYVYPMKGIQRATSFKPLIKTKGLITSFLYKQNYVCMGFILTNPRGSMKLSFPTYLAERIQEIANRQQTVYAYFDDFKMNNQLEPPSLHALVCGTDTLRIENLYYGGADGRHEMIDASIVGTITKTQTSDAGQLMGVIVNGESYLEIPAGIEPELLSQLRMGKELVVEGEERVKLRGEIYHENYRIVQPTKITVDGKVFLLATDSSSGGRY